MTTEDYKLYLEEKFKGLNTYLHAEFENVHDTLDKIENHAKETNGKIADAEREIANMKIDMLEHTIECPLKDKVANIEKRLVPFDIISKNPKVIGFILFLLLTGFVVEYFGVMPKRAIKNQVYEYIQQYQVDTLKHK